MANTFEQSREEIAKLAGYFRANRNGFHAPGVKEAHIRLQFIDPFFIALGWNVRNEGESRVAPQYREVIVEASQDVEGHRKAPDYAFRVGQTKKFYAEAKRCRDKIKREPEHAYQLRRYAWSAKLPLSILTDFEALAVYNCRVRPSEKDKASEARIHLYSFEEYVDCWREIWDVFSREAVWAGSFDRYSESKRGKRGTSEVDAEFLKEIEGWREVLARNMALRNARLTDPDDLSKAVQLTVDRIIFLRMAEDRGIEPYKSLFDLSQRGDIYKAFMRDACRAADEKYNSGLFDFQTDTLTPKLAVDDKVLKPILAGLYFPKSPYEFRALPVEILGSVYERFLGKTIRLTAGRHAKVEEKPEVRKAGGVYYTPAYIVDYIVKHTVGEMIEGKSPAQLVGGRKRQPFRVLDMACGSGSFLLGAYQCLMAHCLNWYVENRPEKFRKAVWKYRPMGQPEEEWRLTIGEKKRILAAHIFGVDIDPQAVEVAKLSLLLKVLEGENDESFGKQRQRQLFQEQALPNLDENIKCGNSLIGPDYFAGQLLVDPEEMRRVNAFDWKREFPDAMEAGGFDCIIGNPPWGSDFGEKELEYHRQKNREVIVRMVDSFMYFVFQGAGKLKAGGALGMIVPDVILYQGDNHRLRETILREYTLTYALNLGNVFDKVTRPASIVVFQKREPSASTRTAVADLSTLTKEEKPATLRAAQFHQTVLQEKMHDLPGCLFVTSGAGNYDILEKVKSVPHKALASYVDNDSIQRGVSPDLKKAFLVSTATARRWKLERSHLRKVLTGGKQVKRYHISDAKLLLIYTSRNDNFTKLPRVCAYINQFRREIRCREVKEGKHPLYALHRPRDERLFVKESKVIGVITSDRIILASDKERFFATDGLYVFSTKDPKDECYLLGILNSRLFVFLYRLYTREKGRVLAQVKPTVLLQLPVRRIDFSHKADKAKHDRMVALVKSMLALHKSLAAAKSDREKEALKRQIDSTDAEIDKLVYDLYGLTDEEIKIVEEAARSDGR